MREALITTLAGSITKNAVQLISGIVVARQIGPNSVGVATAALILVGIGNLISDGGLAAFLVLKTETPSEDEISTVASLQLIIALCVSAIAGCLSTTFADVYTNGRYVGIYIVAGLIVPVQAFSSTSLAVLRRNFQASQIQAAMVTTFVVGYAIPSIVLAYAGAGPWSITLALLVQALLQTIWLSRLTGRRHYLRLRGAGQIWRNGRHVLFANIGNWTVENIDNIIIGAATSPIKLAFYSRSYQLFRNPTDLVLQSSQQVMFPAFAHSSNSRRAVLYLKSTLALNLCLIPFLAIVGTMGRSLMVALYGPQWTMAGVVVLPLCIAMAAHAIVASSGPLLWGAGRAGLETRVQVVAVILLLAGLWPAAMHSLGAAAWYVAVTYLIRALLCQTYAFKLVRFSRGDYLYNLANVLVTSAVGAIVSAVVRDALSSLGDGLLPLAISGAAGLATTYLLWIITPSLRQQLRSLRRLEKVS